MNITHVCTLILSANFFTSVLQWFVCVCVCVCVYKLKQINLYLQYSVTISDDDILADILNRICKKKKTKKKSMKATIKVSDFVNN